MIQISDGEDNYNITDDVIRVIETECMSCIEWITNAIREKYERLVDKIVILETDKNPGKISLEEKVELIKDKPLKTAREQKVEEDEIA